MADKQKRVYISGPISNMPDLNKSAFMRAEQAILAEGNLPVNPHVLPKPAELTWEGYMRRDIAFLVECDEVLALPGCGNSKGAQLEMLIASALGMPIRYAGTPVEKELSNDK